jgi:hypothetical protein
MVDLKLDSGFRRNDDVGKKLVTTAKPGVQLS